MLPRKPNQMSKRSINSPEDKMSNKKMVVEDNSDSGIEEINSNYPVIPFNTALNIAQSSYQKLPVASEKSPSQLGNPDSSTDEDEEIVVEKPRSKTRFAIKAHFQIKDTILKSLNEYDGILDDLQTENADLRADIQQLKNSNQILVNENKLLKEKIQEKEANEEKLKLKRSQTNASQIQKISQLTEVNSTLQKDREIQNQIIEQLQIDLKKSRQLTTDLENARAELNRARQANHILQTQLRSKPKKVATENKSIQTSPMNLQQISPIQTAIHAPIQSQIQPPIQTPIKTLNHPLNNPQNNSQPKENKESISAMTLIKSSVFNRNKRLMRDAFGDKFARVVQELIAEPTQKKYYVFACQAIKNCRESHFADLHFKREILLNVIYILLNLQLNYQENPEVTLGQINSLFEQAHALYAGINVVAEQDKRVLFSSPVECNNHITGQYLDVYPENDICRLEKNANSDTMHSENPKRIQVINEMVEANFKNSVSKMISDSNSRTQFIAEIKACHEASYLERVEINTQKLSTNDQYMLSYNPSKVKKTDEGRKDTRISKGSIAASNATVSTLLDMHDTMFSEELDVHNKDNQFKYGFVVGRPPGHHAEYDREMGFCLVSNAFILAKYAIQKGNKKVLIIDFDAHHGNGTLNLILHNKDATLGSKLYFIDLFSEESFIKPSTNIKKKVKNYNKQHNHIQLVELKEGTQGEEYLTKLNQKLALIGSHANLNESGTSQRENFSPDLIIVSAGFDAVKEDNGIGYLGLDSNDYYLITDAILNKAKQCNSKVIFTLEGGYHHATLQKSVRNTLFTICNGYRPVDECLQSLKQIMNLPTPPALRS